MSLLSSLAKLAGKNKTVADVMKKAPAGSLLGKGAKIAGIGGAGYVAIDQIKNMVSNDDKDKNTVSSAADEQDNDYTVLPAGNGLPSNVVPFRVNKSLRTKDIVPDHLPDDVKIDILEKKVAELEGRIETIEKVEVEKQQSLVMAQREDKLEKNKKVDNVVKDHISGKSKGMIKDIAKDSLAPLLLMLGMNMNNLASLLKDANAKVESMETDMSNLMLKLATAGIPGFALADVIRRKLGIGKPKTPTTVPSMPGAKNVPEPHKATPKGGIPEAANDNRISKLEQRLKMLKAPPWVFNILNKLQRLTRITSSKIPFIGAMITIVLETIEQYDPNIHKDPIEFQKLLIRAIVVGLGQALTFGAIIALFTLIGGPLGTLAGVLVYVFAGDKIDDVIRTELVGYLVKYVFYDEDPIEAAKESGRYKSYEKIKQKTEEDLRLAQGNLKVLTDKEARGEVLNQRELEMKSGYEAQIKAYNKRTEILTQAQEEKIEEAKRQKEYLDKGRAEERKKYGIDAPATSTPEGLPGNIDALKSEIASGEGGYGSFNKGRAGDSLNSKEFDLQNMTVAEVMAAQKSKGLFAVGKYQFIPKTLEEAVAHTGVDPSAKFDKETQEKLFPYLISSKKRPNLAAYLEGKHDNVDAALDDLAYEFASIPDKSGKGKYDGDSAGNAAAGGLKRAEKIKDILKNVKEAKKEEKVNKSVAGLSMPTEMDTSSYSPPEKVEVPIAPTVTPERVEIPQAPTVTVSPSVPNLVAPPAPPVTVINNMQAPQVKGSVERSTLPDTPADIPSPVTVDRPELNTRYSQI